VVLKGEGARQPPFGTEAPVFWLPQTTHVGEVRLQVSDLQRSIEYYEQVLGLHFAILLPGRATLGRFAAHLSVLGIRVGMADHLESESIYLWDPDGLGIEVYADRPAATWQRLRFIAMRRGWQLPIARPPKHSSSRNERYR
jgi:catechol 2,3-dioxygenase